MKNKALLSLVGILLLFLALEIGTRVYKGEYRVAQFLEEQVRLFRSAFPVQFDSELGWIPKENFSEEVNVWKTKVTILKDGIRSNGEIDKTVQRADSDNLILAVGDSFTFGDGVSDNETWPAFLEANSKKKVINGGVFAYGLDQSFLRMKSLTEKYDPEIIILSFIPDDVSRSQYSTRDSKVKPYFEVQDGGLVLNDDHVIYQGDQNINPLRKILGYSFFAHEFMMNFFRHYWLLGAKESAMSHTEGEKVACLIFEELNKVARDQTKPDIYVLLQYPVSLNESKHIYLDRLLKCIDKNYINVIDVRDDLMDLRRSDPEKFNTLFSNQHGHMTPEGNKFIADIVWQNINSSKN